MTDAFTTLDLAISGAVARLTLGRPERLNALSVQCLRELIAASALVVDDDAVKVVVVAGAGRSFCAGADLATFAGESDLDARAAADLGRRMAEAIEAIDAVTIARLHGWCIGGGLVLASACDIRVAARSTRFSIPEVDLGIPLTWGGVPRLAREIGPAMTRELVMTCREFDAAEAKEIGFLNRVVDDDELDATVDALVGSLEGKSRYPLVTTKRQVRELCAGDLRSSWSDAELLTHAAHDTDSRAAGLAYLARRTRGSASTSAPSVPVRHALDGAARRDPEAADRMPDGDEGDDLM